MERRSALKALTSFPFIKPLDLNACKSNKVFEPKDNFESTNDIAGLGVGIKNIDSLSNGFFGGQLISIFGPDDRILNAFLVHTFLYQGLAKKFKVDYVEVGGSLGDMDQNIARFLGVSSPSLAQQFLSKQENVELLHTTSIDLGDSANLGWKDFVRAMIKTPPKSIIVDDIGYIEQFFEEKHMPRQLKELADNFNIPVFVKAPLKTGKSVSLRRDFETISDVFLRLEPTTSSAYLYNGEKVGTRFVIGATLSSSNCPCEKHKGYGGQVNVSFIDYNLGFSSL